MSTYGQYKQVAYCIFYMRLLVAILAVLVAPIAVTHRVEVYDILVQHPTRVMYQYGAVH